jgi:nicotinate-nucleotide--dimethylbenzimidazole phosphoribosyltransferase
VVFNCFFTSHTLARWTAPYLIWRCNYIEEDGPKSNFYSFMIRAKFLVSVPRVFFSFLFSYGVTAVLYGPLTSAKLIVAVWVFAEFAGSYGRNKLGGVMGDFLGGTICLAELFIYASLAGGSVLDIVKSFTEVLMDPTNSSSEILESVLQDQKLRLLARFALISTLYQVWCWLVQSAEKKHSDKKRKREESASKANKSNDEKAKPSSPQKVEAQNVLKSSTASFMDKYNAVQAYLDVLAKPVGSLGTLEEWAARISVLQSSLQPKANHISAIIFAGDHGVTVVKEDGGEGCSLYPQAVTRAILMGLQQNVGGASVLAQGLGLNLSVVDVGVVGDPYTGTVVNSAKNKLTKGTRNFCVEPAMTMEEVDRCILMGKEAIAEAAEKTSCQVVALGEVGIGNTTTASTLIAALTRKPVADLCGGGAFASHTADDEKIKRKIEIVETALEKHKGSLGESISILSKVGGSEIAALVGAMIEASDRKIAVLVDGFIVTAAALIAVRMKPSVCNVLFLTTKSAEKGQVAAIEQIQAIAREHNLPVPASPALSMGLRMGECTGALLAVPILQSSATMITNMATIQDILS